MKAQLFTKTKSAAKIFLQRKSNIKNVAALIARELARIKNVEALITRELAREKNNLQILEKNLGYYEADSPLKWGVIRLLDKSDKSIRFSLFKILSSNQDIYEDSGKAIYAKYKNKCQGLRSNIAKINPPDYEILLGRVAKKIGVQRFARSTWEIEQEVVSRVFKKMLDSSQMEEFQKKLTIEKEKHGKSWGTESGTAAAIAAAQASGFGVYLAASTILGGLMSAVGVTAPFVLYTTMSSAISLAIGPIGWALLAAHVVGKVFGPSEKKIFEATLLIAAARINSIQAFKEEIENKRRKIAEIRSSVIQLQEKLSDIKRRRRDFAIYFLLLWTELVLYVVFFSSLFLLAIVYIATQQRETTGGPVAAGAQETVGTSTAAEINAADELDIREATFRYQFGEHSSLNNPYYLSVSGEYGTLISGKYGKQSDPPANFMKRFAENKPPVKMASECNTSADKGVVDKMTGERGIIFETGAIEWISDTDAEISGSYYANGLAASGNTYYLKKVNGKWKVIKSVMVWIS